MAAPAASVASRRGGRGLALGVLCTLLFLTFLDNTVVSVALGNVQASMHAGVSALQWVVGAYALSFASVMLACGMIADELGRKRVMLVGVGVFCAGSVLAALAPDVSVLIAGRVVMGLGAAASEPGTLSMLRQLYRDERSRAQAIGVWAAVSGLALALGPVVGGTLVGVWSWRGIFWFNTFFGVLALLVAMVVLPESSDPDAHRVDVAGTFLGAGTLAALVFAVIQGENNGFSSTEVIILFVVSAVGALAFTWWEHRAAHPLLDLSYLRRPAFSTANVAAFCTYFATFAIFFFTALYLEEVVGYSGYHIARVFLPMTVLMIASSLAAGRWGDRIPPRWSILGGCVLFAAGLLLTNVSLDAHPRSWALALTLALTGIGIGFTIVPITVSAMGAVPAARSGMAASATNTSREIGAVTGVAVLGALVNAELHSGLITRLHHLGIPSSFESLVVQAIETGGVPSGAGGSASSAHAAASAAGAGTGTGTGTGGLVGGLASGGIIQRVIDAAYGAFRSGLHDALYLSAGLVLLAGLLAALTLRSEQHQTGDQ